MRPRLVEFLVDHFGIGFFVPDYAFAFSVAIVLGLYLAVKQAERAGLEPTKVFRACLITMGVAFVGARLYIILGHPDIFSQPFEISQIWKGGTASSGAYIGGMLAAILAAKWLKLSVGKFLDCCAPSVVLAMCLGRIGCFLNGCCHGKTSGLPWAMRFPEDSAPYYSHLQQGLIAAHQLSLPVHPTQLYESLYAALVFCFLLRHRRNQKADGELFAILFVLYPLGRFLVEFLRDDDRGFVFVLSLPQVYSIIAAALAVSFLLARRREMRFAPGATTVSP